MLPFGISLFMLQLRFTQGLPTLLFPEDSSSRTGSAVPMSFTSALPIRIKLCKQHLPKTTETAAPKTALSHTDVEELKSMVSCSSASFAVEKQCADSCLNAQDLIRYSAYRQRCPAHARPPWHLITHQRPNPLPSHNQMHLSIHQTPRMHSRCSSLHRCKCAMQPPNAA